MDNADGKQARKTNNSSPLGLLFDHGADSLNTALLAMTLSTLIQNGITWYLAVCFVILTTGFCFSTYEEYYTGKLILPTVNAVSDGCFIIFAASAISAISGIC